MPVSDYFVSFVTFCSFRAFEQKVTKDTKDFHLKRWRLAGECAWLEFQYRRAGVPILRVSDEFNFSLNFSRIIEQLVPSIV